MRNSEGKSVPLSALVFVFLILAAQYESWSLPISVLLAAPIAVFGVCSPPRYSPSSILVTF